MNGLKKVQLGTIALIVAELFLATSLFPSALALEDRSTWTARRAGLSAPGYLQANFDLLRQRASKDGAAKGIREEFTGPEKEKWYFGPEGIRFEVITPEDRKGLFEKWDESLRNRILMQGLSHVALKNGEAAGYFVALREEDPASREPYLHLRHLFTNQTERRQGIARGFFLLAAKKAMERNLPLRMEVHVENTTMLAFAEKIGFQKEGLPSGSIWNLSADAGTVFQNLLLGYLNHLRTNGTENVSMQLGNFAQQISVEEAESWVRKEVLRYDLPDRLWVVDRPEELYLPDEERETFRRINEKSRVILWLHMELASDDSLRNHLQELRGAGAEEEAKRLYEEEKQKYLEWERATEVYHLYHTLSHEDRIRFHIYNHRLLHWAKRPKDREGLIGILQKEKMAEHLVTLVHSPDPSTKKFAAFALGDIHPSPPLLQKAIAQLEKIIGTSGSRYWTLRSVAVHSLSLLDPERPDAYFETLAAEREDVREAARDVLAWRAEDKEGAQDGGVREVAEELNRMRDRLRKAIEEFHQVQSELNRANEQEKERFTRTIQQKENEALYLDRLIERKKDEAVEELKRLGADVIPELLELLNGEELFFKTLAVRTLVKIGSPSVPGLITGLQHQDWFVQAVSSWALGEIGDPSAIPPLLKNLKEEKSWEVRAPAAWALGTMAGKHKVTSPDAVKGLKLALKEEKDERMIKAIQWALDVSGGKVSLIVQEPWDFFAPDGGTRADLRLDFERALEEFLRGEEGLERWEAESPNWNHAAAEEHYESWKTWLEFQQSRFIDWGRGSVVPESDEARALEPLMEEFLKLMERTARLFQKHRLDVHQPLGLSYIQAGNFDHFLLAKTDRAAERYSHASNELRQEYFDRELFGAIRRAWEKREAIRKQIRKLKGAFTVHGVREVDSLIREARRREDHSLEEEAFGALIQIGRYGGEDVREETGQTLHRRFPLAEVVFDFIKQTVTEGEPPHAELRILPGIGGVSAENVMAYQLEGYLHSREARFEYLSDLLHRGTSVATITPTRFRELVMGSPEDLSRKVLADYAQRVGTSKESVYLDALIAYAYRMLELLPRYGSRHRRPVFRKEIPQSILKGLQAIVESENIPEEVRRDLREAVLQASEALGHVSDGGWRETEWQPLGTRQQTEAFVHHSVYPGLLYHGTTEVAKKRIEQEGLRILPLPVSRRWAGNGIYLESSREVAEGYARDRARDSDSSPIVIEVRALLRNPKRYTSRSEAENEIEASHGETIEDRKRNFQKKLRTEGYDSMLIQRSDGDEIITFEERQVMVVTGSAALDGGRQTMPLALPTLRQKETILFP